ncbi:unnamed protein product [Closterium sp. NIES-54]
MATITAVAAARGGQRGSLPLPDDPTPQQLHEWVLQRAHPDRGGFGFLRTAQSRQQSQQETFSPQVLIELYLQRCVTGSVEAATPGASESAVTLGASEADATLGARESAAALGARASPATVPSSAEALHTFTLDSGASRCFLRECTSVTPLAAPVPVSLADPTGGPVAARASTVLPCPVVPSGSLSGLHLPTFSTNLVSNVAIQDVWVDTFILGGQRVAIGTQVSASGQLAASCSCRVLSHQTLLWHHRLGHPSLPRLRGMHSRLLVSGLPRSLPPLPCSPALPCLPCVEGRQRAAPHSSEFPPTTALLQTLHMDVWGPAPVGGMDQERYFLLVVDDYTRYTTVFPLRRKADVSGVLIPWIRATRRQLRERFSRDFPVLRLHSERGDEFSSDLLAEFYRDEGIVQSFTLPASPQKNGIAERRIDLIIEVARTSMIHAAAPHFLWPFAVQYAAHQLNLWPRGPAPSGVSQVDPPPLVEPLEISSESSGPAEGGDPAADDTAATFETAGVEPGGFETKGEGSGGAATGGAGSWRVVTGGADSGGPARPSGSGAVGDPTGGPGAGQPPQPDLLETLSPRAIPASPGGTAPAGGTRGAAGAGGAGATSPGGTAGAGGAGGSAGARGTGAGGTGGAGAAGHGGARTRGTGAIGAGGAAGAGGAGGATGAPGTRGAGGTTGARGPGAVGASGAADAGGAGGAAGAAGAGATGAGGAGAAGTALCIPFFYPQPQSSLPPPDSVLRQVLSLPSSTGLPLPLLCSLTLSLLQRLP